MFNYLPIRFDGEAFEAGVLPYESSEQLSGLRDRLKSTHVVVRDGGRIVCVPLLPGAESVGERSVIGTAGPDLRVATRLVHARLVRVLTEKWDYLLRGEDPVQLISRLPGRDLLEGAPGGGGADGLHVYPVYELDVRRCGPNRSPGIVVGLKARREIDWSVRDLVGLGVEVKGRYVLAESPTFRCWPSQDPTARRKLLGQVSAVSGDRLVVRTRDGVVEVDSAETWIEPDQANFDLVLRTLTGQAYPRVATVLEEKMSTLISAENRLTDTARVAEALVKLGPLDIAQGVRAVIGRPLRITNGGGRKILRLSEPTFAFDQGGDKTHQWPDHGLTRFGPLDSVSFKPKSPHIAVVVPSRFRKVVESFTDSFRDGVRGSSAYPQGFVRKFRLTGCTFSFTTFDGDVRDATAYRRACRQALEENRRIDLAMVVTSATQEHLTGNHSPYLVSKSTFMGQGVPVQEFQVENITSGNIAHLLSTMALACYAKLGGTPFAINVPGHSTVQELVFGIGSAHLVEDRMGDRERFVGITTVFSSDGRYLVSNASREATYEQYPRELLEALRVCITEVGERNGWRADDVIRLIFHVFKPLKNREVQSIKESVERLVEGMAADYARVEFAFVTVSEQHSWLVLDRNSAGIGEGPRGKGKFVPARGYAVPISRYELLVTVKGPREMKSNLQGAPRPLLLKLHPESTFANFEYLAEQVFRFTAMSWRRPFPNTSPVTILYSSLIAELLGRLRQVTNWNSDIIFTKLKWSRWFL
ncbi:argonaute/piwi family protein [Saccharothrix syringae]|uniref:Protein argonaute n=1 Tax=Saccharothrix syringae TaxID=103733 RepID=A0A5Q0GYF5_SACSY|nr:Piwi domain-containing protein [Saccharothrix syringae]QFZ18520.1 hypothetical protein EKG83_14500 [Saccharothrix syringae]